MTGSDRTDPTGVRASTGATLRALQVIGDSDADEEAAAAMALHTALAARGVQIRTLVLGPGREGGLEVDLPVISHGRRSLAARTALLRERRWADVVIHRGVDASLGLPRSRTASVLACWNELTAGADVPPLAALRRAVRRSDAVVNTWSDPARETPWPDGAGSDAAEFAVIPACAPPGAIAPTSPAARLAAKRELGLDPDRIAVRVVGSAERAAIVEQACATTGVAMLVAAHGDSGAEHTGRGHGAGRAELVIAAADVVVAPFVAPAGPSQELLRAIRAGSVPLGAPMGAQNGADSALLGRIDDRCLLDSHDPVSSLAAMLRTLDRDRAQFHAIAEAARVAVAESCSAEVVGRQWEQLLTRLVGTDGVRSGSRGRGAGAASS